MALYPTIDHVQSQYLDTGDGHQLYLEECGNPQGVPVVFLHGGPGGGCTNSNRCYFNPDIYRIILFDQRGAGRSKPHASLENNTTQDLIADMEMIRNHLNIDKWLVFGGSWGSTLALAYAQAHPAQVLELIVRGIFLCRDTDVQWFYQHGASRLFPDYWQDFIAPVAADNREDMIRAYYELLTCNDEATRLNAAKAWSSWEGKTLTLINDKTLTSHFSGDKFALALARIECHYFINHSFMQANPLLDTMHTLASIPGVIVHGRYDVVCPVDQAYALHKAWPGSQLHIIPDAGHAVSEPGIEQALIEATDAAAARLT